MKNKILSILIVLCMIFILWPTTVFADESCLLVKSIDTEYGVAYSAGRLRIMKSGCYIISNSKFEVPCKDSIMVFAKDGPVTIIFDNVNIDVSDKMDVSALGIYGNCDTKICLSKGSRNILVSGSGSAGIQKENDHERNLTILGEGTLEAIGNGGGAGIGGDIGRSVKNITIDENPTIIATSNFDSQYGGAGIGGGFNGGGENITIKGGFIKANAGNCSAGIGGGGGNKKVCGGDGINIFISGGNIEINPTEGSKFGAGIGGGVGGVGRNIQITGGCVIANAGLDAAGIGGGKNGNGENITIAGISTVVKAVGKGSGAGIGGGLNANGININILGGLIFTQGWESSIGVGGGKNGFGACISISKSAKVYQKDEFGFAQSVQKFLIDKSETLNSDFIESTQVYESSDVGSIPSTPCY